MAKKSNKNKQIKKTSKLLKSKASLKKVDKGKSIKVKPLKKTILKKLAKKIEKKKPVEKKIVKPSKKVVLKKTAVKLKSTPIKKVTKPSKPLKKVVLKKKITKPVVIKKKEILKKEVIVEKVKKEEKIIKPFVQRNPNALSPVKQRPKRRKGGRKRKNKGDEDEPEIMHDELLEQLIRTTKKMRTPPKKPRVLKTFTNPMASLSVALPAIENKKTSNTPKKEPKGKFTLEYIVNSNVGILYEFLTSPSGLIEWFADEVSIHDGIFTFVWEGSIQKAKLLSFKENDHIRLQWLDKPDGTYFEFRIQIDAMTSDISLMITDFADEESDLVTSKRLWDSQIEKLLHVIGSY